MNFYLRDGNDTLYLAENLLSDYPAVRPVYRLTVHDEAATHQTDDEPVSPEGRVSGGATGVQSGGVGPASIIIAQDGRQWLVVEVPEDGTATVLGRWSDRATAEREACAWLDLAEAAL